MYKRIMVPLDGSELAECVIPHVKAIADGCGVGEVVFVRVAEPFQMPATSDGFGGYTMSDAEIKKADARNVEQARAYLAAVAGKVNLSKTKVKTEVLTGKAADTLAEYATKNKVDLIIIASHGRSGVSRWVWGSVSDRILRSASVPVFIVRAPGCVPAV